ncbi:MAG: DNA-binding transcriptional regulator Fis [Gammaproteobacteria bacterium]|nr:MAG: DNA-binding transcriptional regulator Fis [Gammaproteobacteria bacterium]
MTVLETNLGATSSNNSSVINESVATPGQQTLRESVEVAMAQYFEQLDGQEVVDLYELVISEVEAPLLEAVMSYTRGNQTKASTAMGLNRGTLRKKLKKYGML